MTCITLITDFGSRDEYVGVMKGVILNVNPDATVIDITHQIPPQNIREAAHVLKAAYMYFPTGTIHVAVVDPGVGTTRAILAAAAGPFVFLAPDNGVRSLVMADAPFGPLVRVENPRFFLKTVSPTFHGRDIFAPVAAHLSRGEAVTALGPLVDPSTIRRLEYPVPFMDGPGCLVGQVVGVDHFGNLITNLPEKKLLGKSPEMKIQVGTYSLRGVKTTYGDGVMHEPLAIIGSRGYLEITVRGGNAAAVMSLGPGAVVSVEWGF